MKRRVTETIAAAQLADEVGLDVFGIGEHHRLDFAVPSPAVILGAVANATKRIRLTSAVTVQSAADPVRVFEDSSLLDLISHGCAELIVGRGVFTEPFPLFGLDLNNYNELFEEKLDLLQKLNQAERITWSGRFRSPLRDVEISPRPLQGLLPLWVGVGGTPESAVSAGELGLPMAVAVLGGPRELTLVYGEASTGDLHTIRELAIKYYGDAKFWPILVWTNPTTLKGATEETKIPENEQLSVLHFVE